MPPPPPDKTPVLVFTENMIFYRGIALRGDLMLGTAFAALHRYGDVLVQVLASGGSQSRKKRRTNALDLTLEMERVRRRPDVAGPSIGGVRSLH